MWSRLLSFTFSYFLLILFFVISPFHSTPAPILGYRFYKDKWGNYTRTDFREAMVFHPQLRYQTSALYIIPIRGLFTPPTVILPFSLIDNILHRVLIISCRTLLLLFQKTYLSFSLIFQFVY